MALQHTTTHPSRIHSVRFCKRVNGEGELLLVAAEDKKVSIYQISEDPQSPPAIIAEMVGHANRFVHTSDHILFTDASVE
jgi:protein MAK11